ncbi:MAG: mucoidy inhibitor MuiA family protein [Planctomycetes bacterium]|nr:mucoidy inhibitor MuiA family protein [Planctomycetota bacterium]
MKTAYRIALGLIVALSAMLSNLSAEPPRNNRDSAAAPQKTLEVSSKIDRVTVYPDRALVTREVKTGNLVKGVYEVQVKDLPMPLQNESVRVTSSDPDNLKVIGLDIKTYQLERPPEDKIRALQDQLQQLQDALRVIDDNTRLLQAEREYLNAVKDAFLRAATQPSASGKEGTLEPRLAVKDYEEMLKYYTGKLRTNTEATMKEDLNRRETNKKIALVSNELSKLGIYQNTIPQKKSVKVNIEVLKDGDYGLALSYINFGVNWQASYDIRVFTEAKEMELIAYGVVTQNSGEDWLNASLSFSTARPALQGWLPELPPCYVNLPHNVEVMGKYNDLKREQSTLSQKDINYQVLLSNDGAQNSVVPARPPAPETTLGLGGTTIRTDLDKMMLNQYLPSDVASSFSSVVFHTPKRVDILSDGAPHRTSLWTNKLPVRFEYISTPKISPYVYLRALGTNKLATPILHGTINVFMGSDFIGSSQTASILPDEEFELTLTVDENLRVKRKLEEKEEKGPGFFGSSKHITYSFIIELENYKKENSIVTLVDQIPVSQNENITVELGQCSEQPVEKGKDGKLKWKFDLKPKETKKLTFTFTVSLPKNYDPAFYNETFTQDQGIQQLKMKKY